MKTVYSCAVADITIGCENCGAILQIAAEARTANCPYCDHPSVVERPATVDKPTPSFVLGFVLAQKDASEVAARWMRSTSLFVRSDFRRAAVEKTRAVYLPAYLYGGPRLAGRCETLVLSLYEGSAKLPMKVLYAKTLLQSENQPSCLALKNAHE